MKLTQEHVRALAALDRDMDSGVQPFVVRDGRWAFPAVVLEQCGCVNGQTVDEPTLQALMEAHVGFLEAEIARRALRARMH